MSLHETTRSLSLNNIKHSNDNVSFLPVYYSCWCFTMARSSSAADTPSLFPSPRLRPPPLQLRRKGNKPVWSSPSHLFTSTIIKSFLLLLSESVHSFPQIAAQSRLFVTYCRSDVRCDASSAVKAVLTRLWRQRSGRHFGTLDSLLHSVALKQILVQTLLQPLELCQQLILRERHQTNTSLNPNIILNHQCRRQVSNLGVNFWKFCSTCSSSVWCKVVTELRSEVFTRHFTSSNSTPKLFEVSMPSDMSGSLESCSAMSFISSFTLLM